MSDSEHSSVEDEEGVENLAENTTVIAVNIASLTGPNLIRPDTSVVRTPSDRSNNDTKDAILKGKKLGHRRVKDGEVTYKKFEVGQLMGSIQLGIQNSVGNLNSEEDRDLLHADFYTVETVVFSRDGSLQKTPAHNYSQFKFRTYAPLAFRKFRNIFEIERDKFLVSLCSEPMIELSNPGASGSIFYRTQDDEVICKTVSHKESRFLQEILPAYYLNLHQNFRTLLPKFFGFYCYSCNTKNVRIIVMKNLLPSALEIHHKFDLKGSTYGREASKKERKKAHPTFKDLDFMEMYPEGIYLQPEIHSCLMDTIERDCRALESLKIMDYSLLLGIHIIDPENPDKKPDMDFIDDQQGDVSSGESEGGEERGRRPAMLERVGSIQQKQRLIAHSTALESITAEVDDAAMADLVDETETVDKMTTWGGIPAKNAKGDNLLIFLGIIDILQSFGLAKKLEHTWKSMIHDGDTVSVHRPSFYAKRFKDFMLEKVFIRMPSPLNPTLSVRRGRPTANQRAEVPPRGAQTQGGSGDAVTVITIGPETGPAGGILPSVLRDKPRVSATPGRASATFRQSSRPDVADVVAASCTPPPDLGGVTSGDERVQIYVPSPQSTPYSTISKHADAHRSVTILNYSQQTTTTTSSTSTQEGVQMESLVSRQIESVVTQSTISQPEVAAEVKTGDEPVSISQVYIEVDDKLNKSDDKADKLLDAVDKLADTFDKTAVGDDKQALNDEPKVVDGN